MAVSELKGAKYGFVTHGVAKSEMHSVRNSNDTPQVGELVVGKILSIGKHTAVENRESRRTSIFIGDVLVGVFGNRYATDQYEAYVPASNPEIYDVVSIGGVCGHVASKNELLQEEPTKVQMIGYVCDAAGKRLNIRDHRIQPRPITTAKKPKTIVVVGASMNSGKTTTVANAVRGLTNAGYRVCAAKITGTACSKDTWLMHDAGALDIRDFSDCGHPSTYMISLDELLDVHRTLYSHLLEHEPDYVLFEIADGIFERETAMLLRDAAFKTSVDHVLFTGADALAAESGTRILKSLGFRVAAIGGLVTCSKLGMQEVVSATNLPCLNSEMLCTGGLLTALGIGVKEDEPAVLARPTR
ncbi:MAG: DUF1611 domain-containing protein [Planctomycetes bacterium]|nr:DUF1611 domain-containing protein [Planctomycetota bacterium]MBI3847062.1 DUF1611 domain-containing protein [Planctomycetota bacterium]